MKVSNPPANFLDLLLNLSKNSFPNKLNSCLKTDISIKNKNALMLRVPVISVMGLFPWNGESGSARAAVRSLTCNSAWWEAQRKVQSKQTVP